MTWRTAQRRFWPACASLLLAAAPARAAVPRFDIPSLPLAEALPLYARQSGLQLLFAPGDAAGRRTPALRGRIGSDRALGRLLRGSGLHARRLAGGAILVERDAVPAPSAARAAPPRAAPPPPLQAATPETSDIVVVGTPGGAGARRQDAAFAVSSIDATAIRDLAPQGTADVLRLVPGLTVETSGGKNGANIFVRGYPSGGDAEYVTFQAEGVPFFPPATLSFLENSQLIRLDETVARVETARGGTGALFASGQPGATINIVQREGGRVPEAVAKLGVTSFGEVRADLLMSGPLGADTRGMVGGYVSSGHGIRSPGFTADRGGQITANLRQRLGTGGSLLVFARLLDDRSQWLLPIPVLVQGRHVSAYPGFDPGRDTLVGPETRRLTLPDGSHVDLSDGRGARLVHLGANWDQDLGSGLQLRDKVSWLDGDADTTGLVSSAGAPQTAAAYAASLGGTIATLRATADGRAVRDDQPVVEAGLWTVRKRIAALVNDASLEWRSGPHRVTAGIYAARTRSRDRWNIGNTLLLAAEPHARRLDMVLADGRVVTRDGFTGGTSFAVAARYTGTDVAGYAADEVRLTDRLRVDAGLRYQRHAVDGTVGNLAAAGPAGADGDPRTLYDNRDVALDGTTHRLRYRGGGWSATAGADYALSDTFGLFARYSLGRSFPFFDNLRDGLRLTPRVETIEAGAKLHGAPLTLYATLFDNRFRGLATTVITAGAPIASVGGARATGIEVEGLARPAPRVSLAFSGTWLDARYRRFYTDDGLTDLSGLRVQRQPQWQWRVTPGYAWRARGATVSLSTTVAFTGDRFSDVQNQQRLPRYLVWGAGATVALRSGVELRVVGDNLLDTIGLTEANPRAIGSQGDGAIFARPILGRSAQISLRVSFAP